MVTATMATAAAAKPGWQRAASQSESGKNSAMMTSTAQTSLGSRRIRAANAPAQTRATRHSASSRGGGGSRAMPASPISMGATMMMPIASETNQVRQIVSTGAGEA